MTASLELNGSQLTIPTLVEAARNRHSCSFSVEAVARMQKGRAIVEAQILSGKPLYGITTGVGSQKDYLLNPQEILAFNASLMKAHATRLPARCYAPETVRATLIVLLNGYAQGRAGIRPETAESLARAVPLLELENITQTTSVGAADLVPLAQIMEAMRERGLLENYQAKEALALMSSNAAGIADAALVLHETRALLAALSLACCLSYEGFRCNLSALKVAMERALVTPVGEEMKRMFRHHLADSRLWQEGEARLLQDPLSFRCLPQILMMLAKALRHAEAEIERQMNFCSNNPTVNLEEETLENHGVMDTSIATHLLDGLRQALAKNLRVCGERLHKLHWPQFSGLPVGLTEEGSAGGGVQFLNISHLAEAQACQMLPHAAPVMLHYSAPLADGVEDTAALLPLAAEQLHAMLPYGWNIAAMEAMVACWAIRRRGIPPEALGKGIRPVYETLVPLLPLGKEGKEIFDLTPFVQQLHALAGEFSLKFLAS
jgi:histidine ammonia-lyase